MQTGSLFPMPSEIKPFSAHPRALHSWEATPHSSSLEAAVESVNSFIKHCLGKQSEVSAVLMSLAS